MSAAVAIPEAIPQQLHAVESWLNWKQLSNGNKSPVDQHGKAVGYNLTEAWLPMLDAIEKAKGNPSFHLGISLTKNGLLLEAGYLWCLDFDGFACGSQIDDGLMFYIRKLATYIEDSPSGTGFKAFFVSDKQPQKMPVIKFGASEFAAANPDVKKYQNRAIEIFSAGRFLAFTGKIFDSNTPLTLREIPAQELNNLLDELNQWALDTGGSGWGKPQKHPTEPKTHAETASADEPREYAKPLREDMATVLLYVDAEDEQVYTDTAIGLARTYGEDGRGLFLDYCSRSTINTHQEDLAAGEIDKRYTRALREVSDRPEGYTCKHIIELAQCHPDWPYGFDVRYENNVKADPKGLFGSSDTPIKKTNDLIDEINERFAWDKRRLEIYSRESRMYVRMAGFMANYKKISIPTGPKSRKYLGDYWLTNPKRLEVNGIRMAPDESAITSTGEINTWRGYSCEPIKGDVQPFFDVFNHLLPDQEARRFVLNFCAKMIQAPQVPFNIALGIYGETEGTGKNSIFEAIGELFDRQHFKVISTAELDSQFTEWQIDKVFVVGDEVSNAGDRSKADKLKRLITATSNYINPKGSPAFEQPNLIKYVFLSNHDEIVHIGIHDRRYFIAKTAEIKLPELIADRFYEWKATGGLRHLLYFLQNHDCAKFDPTKPAPMSEAKAEVIDAGKSGLELWVEQRVSKHSAAGRTLITTDELASEYRIQHNQNASTKAIGNALRKAGAKKSPRRGSVGKERLYLYSLSDHETLARLSESELGSVWLNESRK